MTNIKFKELLAEALGHEVWGAHETMGIKFELGKKVEEGRGEFHIWVFCSHWWLQQGDSKHFEDIVNSESDKDNVEKKVHALNNKKLVSVEFHEDSFGMVFDFEDGLFLRVLPYGNDKPDAPQIQIHQGIKTLVVQADGKYRVEEPKETTAKR